MIHTDELLEVLQVRRADDGRGDALLRQDPGDGDLGHTDALLGSDFLDPADPSASARPEVDDSAHLLAISWVPVPSC